MEQASGKTIGFILKGYPRLSETFIINEILLLEQLGFKLHIFALRDPGESKIHDNVKKIKAGVTYIPDYFWPYFGAFIRSNVRLWWRSPSSYWPAFWFALYRSINRNSSSTIKRFTQAAYLVQNCLELEEKDKERGFGERGSTITSSPIDSLIKVEHFHAHFSHGPTTVAYFAAWLTGMNYSFSAHAKDIYLQEHGFLREKIAKAKFVTTCTEFNKNYLQKVAGEVKESVFKCYHGIDLNYFSLPIKSKFSDCPQILAVGRLVPKKGFPVMIEALHKLRMDGHQFSCNIVGGGPMENELQELITKLGLEEWVKLLPKMSQGEVFKYYQKADLFALACEVQSDGDRDGIPNVIVEAMAMGIPIVSTRISGIPECVDDGINGILVEQKDPTVFADALATLIRQPELAHQYGQAGRKKVEQEFDAFQNVEKIGNALRLVCEEQAEGSIPGYRGNFHFNTDESPEPIDQEKSTL